MGGMSYNNRVLSNCRHTRRENWDRSAQELRWQSVKKIMEMCNNANGIQKTVTKWRCPRKAHILFQRSEKDRSRWGISSWLNKFSVMKSLILSTVYNEWLLQEKILIYTNNNLFTRKYAVFKIFFVIFWS